MISAATNWSRLARALDFYSERGFTRVELDWHAANEICTITCPDEGRIYAFDDRSLIGSAEQAFMEAQRHGTLPTGRYVALTPCFRREPVISETHQRHFMKVELYASGQSDSEIAREFASIAAEFMATETSQPVILIPTPEGYDLEIAGIEVGSYSGRSAVGMNWTCGTGLAEPRFSTAVANAEAGFT